MDSENENYENDNVNEISVQKQVPEKKKKTLTEKQLKNLQMMRQKKMAKIEAQKIIQESVRNSAKQQEEDDFSNLKNEINLLKEQLNSRNKQEQSSKSKKVNRTKKQRVVDYSSESEEEVVHSNPYLHQLVRFK